MGTGAVHVQLDDQDDRDQLPRTNWHLSVWLSAAAVVIAALWFYVQLKEWESSGPQHNHMPLVLNVVVTLILWALLITASVTFFRNKKTAPGRDYGTAAADRRNT
jgi:hypothetical protein